MNYQIEFIYFIKERENNDFIKLGRSIHPFFRLQELQNGNPRQLELICITNQFTESELFKKFEKYHKLGEWFYYSDEIKDFLKTIKPVNETIDNLEFISDDRIWEEYKKMAIKEEVNLRSRQIDMKLIRRAISK